MSALGLLAGVAALNAGFLLMMNRAIDAAVGLDQWRKATGLGADELQRIQYGAARANVSAKSVADAIQNILRVRSEIALGNVDASSPWFMLGIDPRQDPLKVLEQLRTALAQMDPSLARNFVSRMGFGDDILYLLQQKKSLGSLFVNPQEIDRLTKLGGAWKAFLFSLSTVATKFASVFADGLARVIGWLEKGVGLMAKFVGWLNAGTTGANAMKISLIGVVAFLGMMGVGLTLIIGLLGLLKGVLLAIQLIPVVAAATLLVGVLAIMAGALVALILLIQDFWTQVDGGKSLFDWNENLILSVRNVERLARAMEYVIGKYQAFQKLVRDHQFGFDFATTLMGNPGPLLKELAGRQNTNYGATITNDIDIHVDGAAHPEATGREVGRNVRREISDAYGTMAIPTN